MCVPPRTPTNLLITQTFKILWISYIIWSVHVNGSLDSQAAVEDEGYNVPVTTGTGPMKGLSTVLKQGVIFRAFFVQPIFRSQSQVCLKGFSQAKYTTGRILISGHFLEDRLRIQKSKNYKCKILKKQEVLYEKASMKRCMPLEMSKPSCIYYMVESLCTRRGNTTR